MPVPYPFNVSYNLRLRMRDGVELSANLWRPIPGISGETFPAILEMIPYRKDDWRFIGDHQRGAYFAQRGFAFCRLDIRGTGSSAGVALDEYTPDETLDGCEVVEWLAAQPWCSGNVGMWGISYGGFTSIQVAMRQPPHLKAIVPMYATDDRYLDDVHYLGGCLTVSELAQYAVSMIAMNAMPPRFDYVEDWAALWKERLEKTPPWTLAWMRQQADGPYWRSGSLAPDYGRIRCAVFSIAGWMDGYPGPALRMQQHCVGAPRKTLAGNWAHLFPDSGYPGPNLDHLHEMTRFFDRWLKGAEDEGMSPAFTFYLREYTAPEPFPSTLNGRWVSAGSYPVEGTRSHTLYLGDSTLTPDPPPADGLDACPHRPAHGTRSAFGWGAGAPPAGLARDLRPDEALVPTYTGEPLRDPLVLVGFGEAVVHVSCDAPVASLVVRLADVAPDGTSAYVTGGILNLTHREGHDRPQPLTPGAVYEVRVPFKATAYRFRPGHRLRVSLSAGAWPLLWPSPYASTNRFYHGPAQPSRLILPLAPESALLPPPAFKTTPPELIEVGGGTSEPARWRIAEDVIDQTVTVSAYDGDTSILPDGRSLFTAERIEMTAHQVDPLRTRLYQEVIYRLDEAGYQTEVRSSGGLRCTETHFVADIQLRVLLNGNVFFERSWLENIPRQGV